MWVEKRRALHKAWKGPLDCLACIMMPVIKENVMKNGEDAWMCFCLLDEWKASDSREAKFSPRIFATYLTGLGCLLATYNFA